MTDEADRPLAFNSVDRPTFWLAAMPESVSPDFTLYEPPDVLDAVETVEEAELPESFRLWPG